MCNLAQGAPQVASSPCHTTITMYGTTVWVGRSMGSHSSSQIFFRRQCGCTVPSARLSQAVRLMGVKSSLSFPERRRLCCVIPIPSFSLSQCHGRGFDAPTERGSVISFFRSGVSVCFPFFTRRAQPRYQFVVHLTTYSNWKVSIWCSCSTVAPNV